jgi:hypothetical protein
LLLLQVPCGSYYAGDEVAILAENSPDVVAAMASALGITEGELDSRLLMQKKQVRAQTAAAAAMGCSQVRQQAPHAEEAGEGTDSSRCGHGLQPS